MGKENVIQTKTYEFAVSIIKVCHKISKEKKEFILTKQLLKSGTSIGANVEEAIGGQTKKDFYAKLYISYKEARETNYWLRLMKDTDLVDGDLAIKLLNDIDEILKILGSILNSMKKNNNYKY